MIKGPKAILSSAITNALADYFVVDPTKIETNLLSGAKIVLHSVPLKTQTSTIPLSSQDSTYSNSKSCDAADDATTTSTITCITTTGSVSRVTFSWSWNVVSSKTGGGGEEWIKDAVLVIEGAKFVCTLEQQQQQYKQKHAKVEDDIESPIAKNEDLTGESEEARKSIQRRRTSYVNPSTIDENSAKVINSTPGGITGFVNRQIKMVVDNLTLRMVDLEWRIVLPEECRLPVAQSLGSGNSSSSVARSFLIAIDELEVLSFGRKDLSSSTTRTSNHDDDKESAAATIKSSSLLNQRLNLRSFRSSILISSSSREIGSTTTKIAGEDDESINRNNDDAVPHLSCWQKREAEQLFTLCEGNVINLIDELAFLPKKSKTVYDRNYEEEDKVEEDTNNDKNNSVEENVAVYHLIEPFSYSADVTRMGSERFSGLMTGLEVVGIVPSSPQQQLSNVDHDDGAAGGIAIHMGTTQVASLMLLGEMIFAPLSTPSSEIEEKESITSAGGRIETITTHDTSSENEPSSFTIPLSFATLIVDDTTYSVSKINILYKADGTLCQFDATKVSYASASGGQAEASQIHISMRPVAKMIIDSIDTLHIPDVLILTKPIEMSEIKYEENALTTRFHAIEIVTFGKGQQEVVDFPEKSTPKQSSPTKEVGYHKEEKAGVMFAASKLPFCLDVSVKFCRIIKSADGSSMEMRNLQLFCNHNRAGNSSDVAFRFDQFKNRLASISDVNMCASFPSDTVNWINALNLSVGDAIIVSGHSVEDWQKSFQPQYKSMNTKSSTTVPSPVIKLPNAAIADMNLTITYAASVGVKVKPTKFTVKAFHGKEATTSSDIINYYTMACLSKVPEFISNAEVLGLNVVDSTAATWANFIGLTTPLGGISGVAAVVGVDAIRNAVSAGKRGRGVSESDNFQAADVARGLFQAAKEATVRGAEMRGTKDDGRGTLIDWAIGATTTTTEYVGENKTRLGGAAAGGGGFMVGMALGGPIGAIVGGLVATAATGKTLTRIDEHQKKKIEQPKLTNNE